MTEIQLRQLSAQLVAPFDQQCRVARRLVAQAFQVMHDQLKNVLELGGSIEQLQTMLPVLLTDDAHRALLDRLYLRAGTMASMQPEPSVEVAKAALVSGQVKHGPLRGDNQPEPDPGRAPASLRLRLLGLVRDLMGSQRVTKLANCTRELVSTALTTAAALGSTAKHTVSRLRSVLLEPGRIALIAQTETLRGWNAGSEWLAELRGKTAKRWIPVLDSATRPAHAVMAGQPAIQIRDLFVVGGMVMRYPGDPAGGAAMCINCRCVVYYS